MKKLLASLVALTFLALSGVAAAQDKKAEEKKAEAKKTEAKSDGREKRNEDRREGAEEEEGRLLTGLAPGVSSATPGATTSACPQARSRRARASTASAVRSCRARLSASPDSDHPFSGLIFRSSR